MRTRLLVAYTAALVVVGLPSVPYGSSPYVTGVVENGVFKLGNAWAAR